MGVQILLLLNLMHQLSVKQLKKSLWWSVYLTWFHPLSMRIHNLAWFSCKKNLISNPLIHTDIQDIHGFGIQSINKYETGDFLYMNLNVPDWLTEIHFVMNNNNLQWYSWIQSFHHIICFYWFNPIGNNK